MYSLLLLHAFKNTHKSNITVKLEGVDVATGSKYSVRRLRRVRAA